LALDDQEPIRVLVEHAAMSLAKISQNGQWNDLLSVDMDLQSGDIN
jgi:hypothetical protein